MENITPYNNQAIEGLYTQASAIVETARNTAYRQINETLVRRNWMLGKLIAEEELNGSDREIDFGKSGKIM